MIAAAVLCALLLYQYARERKRRIAEAKEIASLEYRVKVLEVAFSMRLCEIREQFKRYEGLPHHRALMLQRKSAWEKLTDAEKAHYETIQKMWEQPKE